MKNDDRMEEILALLGPFYIFKLTANFRSLQNGTCNELTDMAEYIRDKTVQFDCIDTALNMFVRMKHYLRTSMTAPGVLRLTISHSINGGNWDELFIDEFPINLKGLQDGQGNEVSFNNDEENVS
jgi:hypothetical protein